MTDDIETTRSREAHVHEIIERLTGHNLHYKAKLHGLLVERRETREVSDVTDEGWMPGGRS